MLSLWHFLQPIILIYCFLKQLPGRDTQEPLIDLNPFDYDFGLLSLYNYALAILFLPSYYAFLTWIFEPGRAYCFQSIALLWMALFYALPQGPRRFMRKHGRWRFSEFYPMAFLLLSSAALSPIQVVKANQLRLPRPWRASTLFKKLPNLFRSHMDAPDLWPSDSVLFPKAVDPACPPDAFFYPEFFEFLPFEEFVVDDSVHPSCLHLSGYSREWIAEFSSTIDPFSQDSTGSQDRPGADDSSVESDDSSTMSDDTPTNPIYVDLVNSTISVPDLSFKSQAFSELSGSSAEAYAHLAERISQGPQVICPTYAYGSTEHLMDPKIYLRQLAHSYTTNPSQPLPVFPILIDTGCSVTTSGFISDFEGNIVPGDFGVIKTANGEAEIKGFGMVQWHTCTIDGEPITVRVPAYFAPDIHLRLFSPQDYARYHKQDPNTVCFNGSPNWFSFHHESSTFSGCAHGNRVIIGNRDPQSGLFFMFAEDRHNVPLQGEMASDTSAQPSCHCHPSFNVHDPKNVNLSRTQKRLLLDHSRLGHVRMGLVQSLYAQPEDNSPGFLDSGPSRDPCLVCPDKGTMNCAHPLCQTCQVSKARRRGANTKLSKPNPETTPILRVDDLEPGDCMSVDQYESSVRGRLPHTRGRERQSNRYCGGTLFYDHASSKIFVRHQVSLGGTDAVESKRSVERECLSEGVMPKKYHADNGVFASKDFEDSLLERNQTLKLCGVGAKHQNAVAERAIGVVQAMARSMLLHVRLHWPDEFDAALWPFALDYAVWIYNRIPQADKGNMSPEEIFSKTKTGCSALRRARVFGCPTYVLDSRLQDGKKIPKWEPRARTGMFLGFSTEHSSMVGMILNIRTGYISPQFHVVYDERFETVTSDMEIDLAETWIDLWQESREFYLEDWDPTIDGPYPDLDPDFRPEANDDDETPDSDEQGEIAQQHTVPQDRNLPTSQGWFDVEEAPPQQTVHAPILPSVSEEQTRQSTDEDSDDDSYSDNDDGALKTIFEHGEDDVDDDALEEAREEIKQLAARDPLDPNNDPDPETEPESVIDPDKDDAEIFKQRSPKKTRSGRAYKTSKAHPSYRPITSRLFSHVRYVQDAKNYVFATLDWENVTAESMYQSFHELFSMFMDSKTKELLDPDAAIHPFSLSAKLESEDYPSFKEIIRMPADERQKWFDSMDEELKALFESGACQFIDRSEVLRMKKEIVKSTWAYRKKRAPGTGEVTRYKSRLCVRGDLQKNKELYGLNETFAPVVEWMTVRLLFTLGIVEGWSTASIDFKNAFTQAQLPEPIYLELPPGLEKANPEYKDKLIEIKTSLYGDRRAANLWYRKIAATLTDTLGFTPSQMDPCLFVRKDCIIVLYVDDAILMARNEESLQGVLKEIKDQGYSFNRDGDFTSYLGVNIENLPNGSVKMSQPHLARSLLDVTGLRDSAPVATPSTGPLHRHQDSKPFDQHFSYRSTIGILQYLGNNTRPDCAYAINSCARFCIEPREAHANAVKRIARYIKGTLDEGLIFEPDRRNLTLDCHVDADLAGAWNPKDPEDPNGVKSRTGFLLTFGGVPLLWKSKLQDCIALSTMESEYIALSTAMRSLIHVRALLKEICDTFILAYGDRISTISTVFEDNRACKILAETDPPRLTPRSKSLAIKYHWFRQHIGRKKGIILEDVASALNKADFLTKALGPELFLKNRKAVCGW